MAWAGEGPHQGTRTHGVVSGASLGGRYGASHRRSPLLDGAVRPRFEHRVHDVRGLALCAVEPWLRVHLEADPLGSQLLWARLDRQAPKVCLHDRSKTRRAITEESVQASGWVTRARVIERAGQSPIDARTGCSEWQSGAWIALRATGQAARKYERWALMMVSVGCCALETSAWWPPASNPHPRQWQR